KVKQWEFQSFVAQASDVTLDPAIDSVPAAQTWYRTIYAHSLTFWPWQAVELTTGEPAPVPRITGGLDWGSLNPLMPYQTTQHETSQNGQGDANLSGFFTTRATA